MSVSHPEEATRFRLLDAAGAAVDDHLEIVLTNTGKADLSGFEVFYTFLDSTAGTSESYYLKLPGSFTIAPGANRTIHFDTSGMADHFAENEFSLYHTSQNALEVTVTVAAPNAAAQSATVQKDAGGAETSD